ncbi:MAG: energy-coupled thiamine transporter ThiT, partial [Bacilli bacterium]|nr:energy-coupled thiamine transporter ThiT [Bacilli bacterium]
SYFAADLIDNFNGASLGWGAAVSIAMCALAALFALSSSSYSNSDNVLTIAEDGVLIAAAFVLSYVKLPIATGGGSVNFQMLPLMIIALRRGPLHGFVTGGVIYGLLTCLTDGYGFATYPFDYLIGFGSAGVMGFFAPLILGENQKSYNAKGIIWIIVGGIASTFVRFVGSTVSSMVIYDVEFVGALIYNAVYIPVSGAIAIAILCALYGPLARVNSMFPAARRGISPTDNAAE